VYKRKCNKPFTKRNSHQTTFYPDPAIRGSSNNTLLKQALCNDNLDKALDWLRHSAREQDNSDASLDSLRIKEVVELFPQGNAEQGRNNAEETVKKWGGCLFHTPKT